VWKFHAVYWPALLLSAGLPLPDEIAVHGFLTIDGRKISKTRTDGAPEAKQPRKYIARFGADAVRYYLLRAIPPFRDSDFSEQGLADVYTADLANGLGNLCTRLTTLCARAGLRLAPTPDNESFRASAEQAVNDLRLDGFLDLLWNEIARLNREIAARKPWEALGDGDVQESLVAWGETLRDVLHWLAPVLPQTTSVALRCLASQSIRKCPPLFPRLAG
jgi:methionyl-tRNA synthetase